MKPHKLHHLKSVSATYVEWRYCADEIEARARAQAEQNMRMMGNDPQGMASRGALLAGGPFSLGCGAFRL